ncbi:MAG: TCP-1/cpn60 chaperonin family protein [Euryarchaeota archaeon]|nr:TCP-1/cpn60 chaperonin family protein [Euryarchaeota archaeon]
MGTQLGGQPILILPEKAQRYMGRDARRMNILAGRIIAEAVRSTLGPKGMDKMLVSSLGDVTITNDGATILKEMDVQHPAAKMMVEIAKTQDDEVGDGTTSAVVIAGELLKRAEELLDQEIHASLIVKGYRMATEHAIQTLNEIAGKVDVTDEPTLEKIALTSITGKGAEIGREPLAKLAVKAVRQIVEKVGNRYVADIDHIKVDKKEGGSVEDTQLINGIIIDKERVHPGMPRRVGDAKIALLNSALEIEKTEVDAKISITSPDQLRAFLSEEEHMLKEMIDKIKAAGATVVICQKGIDDLAQHYLAKAGIFAVRRVKESDMEKLARATKGRIVTNLNDLTLNDLGEAKLVEERKIAGEEMTFIEGCKDPKAVSILVRGGTEHVVDEVERALHDALCVVGVAIEDGKIVAGGGAPEIEVARKLREHATKVGGREQLAINAFADAVESIPRSLAENSGLDPIDMLAALKARHEKDGARMGLNVFSGKVEDMSARGVIEPLRIKTQAIKSASEAATMILRIDDVIAASALERGAPTPPGMPPGGMPEY